MVADFRARNIGFIFQNFSLVPVLSAYENVEYPLLLVACRPPSGKSERSPCCRRWTRKTGPAAPERAVGRPEAACRDRRALVKGRKSFWQTNRPPTSIPRPAPPLSS